MTAAMTKKKVTNPGVPAAWWGMSPVQPDCIPPEDRAVHTAAARLPMRRQMEAGGVAAQETGRWISLSFLDDPGESIRALLDERGEC